MRWYRVSAERQEMAYELYKTLGEKRTYGQVAEIMGLKEKTIQTWGYKNKWQDRLKEDYKEKTNEIRQKREELELLGIDTALAALNLIKTRIENGKLGKETAQTYEAFLRTPLELLGVGETVKDQTACASPSADNKIEICFDINGGVSSED